MDAPGQRDYVGAMYRTYKLHLLDAGVAKPPCRSTFHGYIWMLKETGAVAFDGAEAVSFGDEEPEDLPPDYDPYCGMPAPRHYYRITSSGHPAFLRPRAVWREQRGLAPTRHPRRRPPTPLLVSPVVVAPPEAPSETPA
jgi:hypothetical protein